MSFARAGLPVALAKLPAIDERFGTWREVANLGGDDGLFRNRGLLQPTVKLGQLLTAMTPTFDFLVSLANPTHSQNLRTQVRLAACDGATTGISNRSF